MALFDQLAPEAVLDRLLTQEHRDLLAGRLDALGRLAREKEQIVARLQTGSPTLHQLDRLRIKAERNQVLLAAAARGVQAARDRIDAIRSGPAPMRTYASDGGAAEMPRARKTDVNRRA